MKIYRHLYCEQGNATDADGQVYLLKGWGGSNRDPDDARSNARQRLADMVSAVRLRDGNLRPAVEYEYGTGVVREEWLLLVAGTEEQPDAVVTRNRYGAPVLNSARMAIVDIDFHDQRGCLSVLAFWRSKPDHEAIALARVTAWSQATPQASLRVYRTPFGLRVVRTDCVTDPESAETAAMFEALDADRLYRALCRRQQCFRARLGVKPWRVGLPLPPSGFPRRADTEAAFEAWVRAYTDISSGFAACRYLGDFGGSTVALELQPELDAHDILSEAHSGRPIA